MNEKTNTKKVIFNELLKILREKESFFKNQIEKTREAIIEAPGRMQSRYDSSKQELSYLLSGFQNHLREIQEDIKTLENFKENLPSKSKEVTVGSIVWTKTDSEEDFYFILPVGGGTVIKTEKDKVTIITPQAPLAKSLLKKKVEDSVMIGSTKLIIISIL